MNRNNPGRLGVKYARIKTSRINALTIRRFRGVGGILQ